MHVKISTQAIYIYASKSYHTYPLFWLHMSYGTKYNTKYKIDIFKQFYIDRVFVWYKSLYISLSPLQYMHSLIYMRTVNKQNYMNENTFNYISVWFI